MNDFKWRGLHDVRDARGPRGACEISRIANNSNNDSINYIYIYIYTQYANMIYIYIYLLSLSLSILLLLLLSLLLLLVLLLSLLHHLPCAISRTFCFNVEMNNLHFRAT